MSSTQHQNHTVGDAADYRGIGDGCNGRGIQHYPVVAAATLGQNLTKTLGVQQFGRVGRHGTTGQDIQVGNLGLADGILQLQIAGHDV